MIIKTPETFGMKEVRYPITHVRLTMVDGKWVVQFRRKPLWWIDRFIWFTDSIHHRFTDAEIRTNMLINDKYYTKLVPIQKTVTIDK